MEHIFYFDGTPTKISWIIKSNNRFEKQTRIHADIYYNKLTSEQSKYVAMHVGLFWAIGRFIIKNGDTVNIMVDSQEMHDYLTGKKMTEDLFISNRADFFKKLIKQRELQVNYREIKQQENMAKKST